jgi:hypothetical protein
MIWGGGKAQTSRQGLGERGEYCVRCKRSLKGKLATLMTDNSLICADDYENCVKYQKLNKDKPDPPQVFQIPPKDLS